VAKPPLHPGGARRIIGLLLMALFIVIFVIARFHKTIPWGAR
jgi:hypothetical protein